MKREQVKKNDRLLLRLNRDLKTRAAETAAKHGATVSSYVRQLIETDIVNQTT